MSVKPSTCRLPHFLVKPETDAITPLANCELPVNGIHHKSGPWPAQLFKLAAPNLPTAKQPARKLLSRSLGPQKEGLERSGRPKAFENNCKS